VSSEQLFRGEIDENVTEVVYEIANIAKLHLDKARQLKQTLPKQATPLFLVAVLDSFWRYFRSEVLSLDSFKELTLRNVFSLELLG
jgi:phytoene/squalene synthetase